ncbi:MAG: malQ [Herbinix sp.]|jgi:4-alpha-glucanotransferase|nr:malQ [Herbinix sp.]
MATLVKQEINRGAGVLMPISALPSAYGIGTLGVESFRFVDFLTRIGCCYWQVLPVGPTSFGDSPYQSFSAFAGNPYFIDLDVLVTEGLLEADELKNMVWHKKSDKIDYASVYNLRFVVLKKAYARSTHKEAKEFQSFCKKNEFWLRDYSLYMAIKGHFANKEWSLWDEDIRNHKKNAVTDYTKLLSDEIDFWEFCQFKFREQWDKVKAYANDLGIQIIGDIPLYVSQDSSDVWVHHDLFELDQRKNPINVAGVPPDVFSADGQRWGNPLYRWDVMEQKDFGWWRERMKMSAGLYDIIRIDHFIGVVNYYSIPSACKTAVGGSWRTGPGRKLTDVIKESIGEAKIIAEDLGVITPNVRQLIRETGFPGMKILMFGIDGPANHEYLPHNYKDTNLIAYTGTHDNETLVGYLNQKTEEELAFMYRYFNVSTREELPYAIIRVLYSSIADVVIVQMQDLLRLDNKARMNFPSTIGNNWQWRMKKSQYKELNEDILLEYSQLYTRSMNQGSSHM